jgi:hypothetical protein
MTDTEDFLAEDYHFTADLLRAHSKLDDPALFRAVCSNNLNIILAALDKAGVERPAALWGGADEEEAR